MNIYGHVTFASYGYALHTHCTLLILGRRGAKYGLGIFRPTKQNKVCRPHVIAAIFYIICILPLIQLDRWIQATIVNETEFRLVFNDTAYQFRSGRFWTAPGNIAANSESTFSVCNKMFGVGVNGSVEYSVTAGQPASSVIVSIRCQNEFFGDIRCTASFLEDGKETKTATINVDGVATNICITCAPGNEPKVTIFGEKEPETAASEPAAAPA